MIARLSSFLIFLLPLHAVEVPRVTLVTKVDKSVEIPQAIISYAVKCDRAGNVYTRVMDHSSPSKSPITKIGRDGRVKAVYSFSDTGNLLDFSLGDKGGVFALTFKEQTYKLVKFQPGGKLESVRELPLGITIAAGKMVPIGRDRFLISGQRGDLDGREPAVFIMDGNGDFVDFVNTHENLSVDEHGKITKEDMQTYSNSKMTADESGRVFVLRASDPARILSFSIIGEATKTYQVQSPEPGYWPTMVHASNGRIAVEFLQIKDTGSKGTPMRLGPGMVTRIVDQESGETLIDYAPPAGVGSFVCYSGPSQFLAINNSGNADGMIHLLTLSDAVGNQ